MAQRRSGGAAKASDAKGGDGKAAASSDPRAAPVLTGFGVDGLPPAVADMRAAILAAIETGDIAELREAMELNELKPEVGGPPGSDPIAHLKSRSADGSGKDILDMLSRLLAGSWTAIPGGRDIENNRVYVWPHFAELPLAALSEQEVAALEALVGAEAAGRMREAGRWSWWRLSIGADGVWHMLSRME
jgi:hypothetical protein